MDHIRWMKAPNSEASALESFSFTKCHVRADEMNRYDNIYFVLSPAIVPYRYHHLYDMLVEIFSKEG